MIDRDNEFVGFIDKQNYRLQEQTKNGSEIETQVYRLH